MSATKYIECPYNKALIFLLDNKPETEVVVEKYEPWSDWSSCSAQCGAGHQIRVRPCKVNSPNCTPLQQSQSCVAAAPCQPAATVQGKLAVCSIVNRMLFLEHYIFLNIPYLLQYSNKSYYLLCYIIIENII